MVIEMYYGLIDVEMTCDGKKTNGKFVDDGRMKHSQREVISVGFVVVDDKYRIKAKYSSFVKPVHNPIITSYCQELKVALIPSSISCFSKSKQHDRLLPHICFQKSKYPLEILLRIRLFGIGMSCSCHNESLFGRG